MLIIALPQPNLNPTPTPPLPQPNLNLKLLVGGELLCLVPSLSLSLAPVSLFTHRWAIYSKASITKLILTLILPTPLFKVTVHQKLNLNINLSLNLNLYLNLNLNPNLNCTVLYVREIQICSLPETG